jgi:hypothetical protein
MAASCILEGLLLLLMIAVESGVISDGASTKGSASADGFGEDEDGGSCSVATRKDAGDDDNSFDMSFSFS